VTLRRTDSTVLASLAGAGALIVAVAMPWVHFTDRAHIGDVRHYRAIAERILDGRIPYHQFFVEYPPGALPVFLLPTIGTSSSGAYGMAFRGAAIFAALVTLVVVARTVHVLGGDRARTIASTVFVGIAPALLGSVFLLRYDIWAAALTSLATLAMVRRRTGLSAALLGLGAVTKVYPVLLVPLLLLDAARRFGRATALRAACISAAVFVLVVGPFASFGLGGVAFSFKEQLTRVLEIESLGGTVLLAANRVGAYHATVYPGLSYELLGRLPDAAGALQTLLLAAGLVTAYWAYWRSEQTPNDLVLAVAAVLALTVTLDKVLSPQYLVWLVPAVALLWGRVAAVAWALLAAAMVMTAAFFQTSFYDLRTGGAAVWLVLGRNLVLVALAVFLLTALVRNARRAEVDTLSAWKRPGGARSSRSSRQR
jgi:Glycosyltransferase family 87